MNDYEPKPLKKGLNSKGISEKTIQVHYNTLYKGYVKKMNEIGSELAELARLDDLSGNQTYSELRALRRGETFATNGAYLHEYYFHVLGGDGEVFDNALIKAIKAKWGSFEHFQTYFTESAMSMRGWVVLCWDVQKARLKVYGCDTHDEGGVWGCLPIFALDVFEHSYYMDYASDRKEYIQAFWKNMDWNKANDQFVQWSSIVRD